MRDFDDVMDGIRAEWQVEDTFHSSRDFLVACEVLKQHRDAGQVYDLKYAFPIQAYVTCASMALELALKCRIALEGKKPPRSHKFDALFALLSAEAQCEIASDVLLNGRPTTAEGVLQALAECAATFDVWRYLHEHGDADFHEPLILDLTAALHRSILRLNPTWVVQRTHATTRL